MSTRERILTIRLLEHLAKHPSYADLLGVDAVTRKLLPESREHMKESEDVTL